ncbi:MAG: universal stress protein [Deltaproteobacteria bacterium]|nr:universal stress protein [Deltaproteobacteria bacterium]
MYDTVLVPLDGSRLGECALSHLESIVRSGTTRKILLVRAVEPAAPSTGEYNFKPEHVAAINARTKEDAARYLEGIAEQPGLLHNGTTVATTVLSGAPGDVIAPYAEQVHADLILMSTHGRSGAKRWIFGSLADKILRQSCIPVLMVRGPGCCVEA